MKLKKISELKQGTQAQKLAYHAISSTRIMEKLSEFNPVLAGTIPIDLDLPNSDLDFICQAENLQRFCQIVTSLFGCYDGFTSYFKSVRGLESFVAQFNANSFDFEIFAQDCPVEKQYAVIHMMVEARLLSIAGEAARNKIRALKLQGFKTEPAFARYFGINGDPYDELAKLAALSDDELRQLFKEQCGR